MNNNIPYELPPLDKLNYFRNLYYTEGNNTERGIIANALNEVLPYLTQDILEQLQKRYEYSGGKKQVHSDYSSNGEDFFTENSEV